MARSVWLGIHVTLKWFMGMVATFCLRASQMSEWSPFVSACEFPWKMPAAVLTTEKAVGDNVRGPVRRLHRVINGSELSTVDCLEPSLDWSTAIPGMVR